MNQLHIGTTCSEWEGTYKMERSALKLAVSSSLPRLIQMKEFVRKNRIVTKYISLSSKYWTCYYNALCTQDYQAICPQLATQPFSCYLRPCSPVVSAHFHAEQKR